MLSCRMTFYSLPNVKFKASKVGFYNRIVIYLFCNLMHFRFLQKANLSSNSIQFMCVKFVVDFYGVRSVPSILDFMKPPTVIYRHVKPSN